MIKKLLFGSLLVSIGGLSLFIYTELNKKPIIRETLSDRSKEYIQKQAKEQGKDQLRYARIVNKDINSTKTETLQNKRMDVAGCFSFVMPFEVKTSYSEKACHMVIAFQNPSGNIIAYLEKTDNPIESWDLAPGVSFRKMRPESYVEEILKFDDKEFHVFLHKDAGMYEKNAFFYTGNTYVVINIFAGGDAAVLDKKFRELLASVELSNN